MRIVYATSTLPYGSREPFLIPEIVELSRLGHDVTIVPMRPQEDVVVHDDILPFVGSTLGLPLICPEIIVAAIAEACSSPVRTLRALRHLFRSRNLGILVKNIGVFPKGLWLSRQVRGLQADHLHADWASTSSTMALVAAEVSGIPWSLTAHRWDIGEDNLLQIKASKACFIRTISEKGARAVAAQLATPARRLDVLHMGIVVPEPAQRERGNADRTHLAVVVIADFVEVKGHRYLIEALTILRDRDLPVYVDLVGGGSLRGDVQRRLTQTGLSSRVTLMGTVPHARLLDDLRAHRWDVAVLPSIMTHDAEEGIPVSLVEAMGAGLPVLSTRTGAIPELLGEGAGLLVDGSDPSGLADALASLAEDADLRKQLAENGRRRVQSDYNIVVVASVLARWFQECACN